MNFLARPVDRQQEERKSISGSTENNRRGRRVVNHNVGQMLTSILGGQQINGMA